MNEAEEIERIVLFARACIVAEHDLELCSDPIGVVNLDWGYLVGIGIIDNHGPACAAAVVLMRGGNLRLVETFSRFMWEEFLHPAQCESSVVLPFLKPGHSISHSNLHQADELLRRLCATLNGDAAPEQLIGLGLDPSYLLDILRAHDRPEYALAYWIDVTRMFPKLLAWALSRYSMSALCYFDHNSWPEDDETTLRRTLFIKVTKPHALDIFNEVEANFMLELEFLDVEDSWELSALCEYPPWSDSPVLIKTGWLWDQSGRLIDYRASLN